MRPHILALERVDEAFEAVIDKGGPRGALVRLYYTNHKAVLDREDLSKHPDLLLCLFSEAAFAEAAIFN